jgi:hypothetical protein
MAIRLAPILPDTCSECSPAWLKILRRPADKPVAMLMEGLDSDAVLTRFNRLLQELVRGTMNRNTFQPWEIEILLDIEACHLREAVKRETLRRYQKAVQRSMEKGARAPLKLSEYLEGKRTHAAVRPQSV